MNAPTDYSVFISHDNEIFLYVQVNPGWIGFNLHFSNGFQTLLTAAEAYFYLGWSVIPLLSDRDPARPKVPAIPWAGFQQYAAQLNEMNQWFQEGGFGGLGIVTGRVSRLVVLDFDSERVFNAFRIQYPDLLETRTVQSAGRGLPHLYFKLPDHLHLTSIKGQGVDLLSDGCYVVAPPTSIAGQTYKVVRGGIPKTLTERDIRRIQAFLRAQQRDNTLTPVKTAKTPFSPTVSMMHPTKATWDDLQRLYHHHCMKGSRNTALFLTSLYARDTGWTPSETQNYLVQLHIQQPAASPQPTERPEQRQREALNTIRSAFSRPARLLKPRRAKRDTLQLSNSVREVLMRQKMTYFIRTYEGLLLTGVKPGQIITAKDAVDKLKGLVGRYSVLNALKATHNGKALFSPVDPHYDVATHKKQRSSKNAFFEGVNRQQKVKMGRPQHVYQMPTNADLCQILGVSLTGSDHLDQNDLANAPQTRMALHRELIKRRPGQYPRRWLAQRLGVNKQTIDRYNRLIPINSRKMFIETPITWKNIERLPQDEAMQGAYLETLKGKKYPALRQIASQLLANGTRICLKEQTANYYWYGDEEPTVEQWTQVKEQQVQKQVAIEAFIGQTSPSVPLPDLFWKRQEATSQNRLNQKKIMKKSVNLRKPLADAEKEALANSIYTTLNHADKKILSLANARHISMMHPQKQILAALKSLQQRKNVTNPVGFLMTLLKPAHS